MAPLTRSVFYELPELPLEAPKVEGKDIQASSYPTLGALLANPEVPRLVTYKNKSVSCASCSKTSTQSCADCRGMVFYCNADCQIAHWPNHKKMCDDLNDQHITEVIESREKTTLTRITEDLGTIISSDFKSLDYKTDPKLSVKMEGSASFGDFYDVSESDDSTMRSVHPGTYKCTSVTPDESCESVIIYHHDSVDPAKIIKQCILMSKDFFVHNNLPNQITMPEWCNWVSADEEYIQSDSDSESEADSEASESDLFFADFVDRVIEDKPAMESDLEDHEYDQSESDSEESESDESDVSDHEVDYLINESKHYIKDIPQKRESISPNSDMEIAEDGEETETADDSEAEAYKDFKGKVLESEHRYASGDESDYLPYSDSESDSGKSVPERDISDSEKFISENEMEEMLESSKDIRNKEDAMYDEFVDNVFDRYHIEESDAEDQDFVPADVDSDSSSEEDEISDSEENVLLDEGKDFIKNLSGKRHTIQTEFYSSESDSDSEVSSEGEMYEDFKIHTEAKHQLSDTEDLEYIPKQSDSEVSSSSSSEDEMEVSNAESDALLDDSKDLVQDISGQKRICHTCEDEDCEVSDEAEMELDDELYNDFRSKLLVSEKLLVEDLGGSDDEEFVPPAESQEESQDESQDEGSQASDKSDEEMDVSDNEVKDLEFSSDEELYEDFKDEVCKTQRKTLRKAKSPMSPCDNKDLIYFMNSQYAPSLKNSLDSGSIENASNIAGSFLLINGSESSGIAVEMKGHNWRSVHAFEDSSSGKCFAFVVSTDTWEHLANNHEHLEAQYPSQKWSSVAETELKFHMKDFVC